MSAKLINIVLDLETLGTSEDAAILQIGCCIPEFDHIHIPTGISHEFESTISYDVALASEFNKDRDTLSWWEQQDTKARKHVFSGQDSYSDAFDHFRFWLDSIRANGADVAVWGNGSDFDNRLLAYSLNSMGYHGVWNFRNNRDLRTIKALFPVTHLSSETDGIKHTALADARYEARLLNTIRNVYLYAGENL
jgi:exodeoxyribonuclease VIII